MKKEKPTKMDNKKLAMIAAAIIILVVAFLVVRFVLVKEEKPTSKKVAANEITENPEEVFEEPPADIKPPALPG